MTGREHYELDVKKRPFYHDGAPRKTWEQLTDLQRSSWNKLELDTSGAPAAEVYPPNDMEITKR